MNKKNISKIFMIFGISILVLAIIGSTFAYYVWTTGEEDTTKIVTGIGAATVIFDGGSDIENANLRPVSDKSKGIIKTINVKGDTTGLVFNMYLDLITLPDALKEESFRYALYNGETLIQEGNFSSDYLTSNTSTCTENSTTHITLLTNEAISTSNTKYTLYIWIDGANYTNPNTMMNQTFSFKLHANGEGAIMKTPTFADKITALYTNAEKEKVANNSITYNTAPSVSLMNDRLGGTTEDLDGGNIRYYGASPDNYIYFNCSDYSNQSDSTCEKWRIIGVFDGKVKIMRGSTIKGLAWDLDKNIDSSLTSYDNDWSTSSLQILLNQKYYNGDTSGTITYYSSNPIGSISTTSLDMSSIGIKNDATKNMISEETWNLGGWDSNSVYSDQIYGYERGTTVYSGRPTTWTGKIALAYPSDYGYAADLVSCTVQLGSYNDSTCTSTNWMKSILGTSNNGWLLTPYSGSSGFAWGVNSSGLVSYGSNTYFADGVAPVLYLSSEQGIESGAGTSSVPYRLSV